MSSGARGVVHLACSRGGHLDLLLRHAEAFAGSGIVWVTQDSARAERLRSEGNEVHFLGEWRGPVNRAAARTIGRSLKLVLKQRPRVVVTSGSGIVVPFCLMARLAGAKVVFVETSARVRGPSSSGRVLSRLADHVIAQWEDMRSVYPHATIARTSIVGGLATDSPAAGNGTFVAVGTHSQPFERLLRAVDRAAADGLLPTPVVAQVGPSVYRMQHAETLDFVTSQAIDEAIGRARLVVCHAGTGTIATALRAGRRPLVMARLQRHAEHFDDHQQQILDKLAALDLIVPIAGEITAADLARAERPLHLPDELSDLPELVDCLGALVRQLLGAPQRTRAPV